MDGSRRDLERAWDGDCWNDLMNHVLLLLFVDLLAVDALLLLSFELEIVRVLVIFDNLSVFILVLHHVLL